MKKINEGQTFKNYKMLCEYLEVPVKTGKSKQLQLSDWNRYFAWHKEGNTFIIDEVYTEPTPKVRKKCQDTSHYGGNNNKNLKLMIDYLMMKCPLDGEYQSITTWLCDDLELLNKKTCNILYSSQEEIESFCNRHGITNVKLFCEYVSTAKSIMKQMFLRALPTMERQELVEYKDGYMFTYYLGARSKGHFSTDALNEIIKQNETNICNEMNHKHHLSEKLSGRQLLLIIYGKQSYTDEFDRLKLAAIMNDNDAMRIANQCIDDMATEYGAVCGRTYIGERHPLLSYYRSIAISEMESLDYQEGVAMDICNIVRKKARQKVFNKHYTNKYTGKIVYPYDRFECATDMLITEKLLFCFYDDKFVDDTALDMVELDDNVDELFKTQPVIHVEETGFADTEQGWRDIPSDDSDLTCNEWIFDL